MVYNKPDNTVSYQSGAAAMMPHPFVIKKIIKCTEDTFTLELKSADNSSGIEFQPGQFNMLYVYGVGEVPVSISGDPTSTKALVHTIRMVGTVTRALRRLTVGETVGVRGPYGSAWPVKKAEGCDVVIVAGGIGLAPLRPTIYYLLAKRKKYGRIVLLYGTRTPADILFRNELEQWRARFDLEVEVTVDRGDDTWWGNVGVVPTLIPGASFDPLNTIAMTCGPEVMMRFTVMALRKKGVDVKDIYVSLERNMKCAIGLCGHCQFGGKFICKDGPVFSYDQVMDLFNKREI